MSETPTTSKPPAGRSAYDRLRWDIVHGVLRPNEALIESELSERLGISRTPIRESLQRLRSDGLIVMRRRRWYVYEHSASEIQELYEVRAALEGFAGQLACHRATEQQLSDIKAAAVAIDHVDLEQRVSVNDAFHDLINEASGNTRLIEQIRQNRLFHFNRQLSAAYTDTELAQSSAQHASIVTAVVGRDAARAEELIRQHIRDAASIAGRAAPESTR